MTSLTFNLILAIPVILAAAIEWKINGFSWKVFRAALFALIAELVMVFFVGPPFGRQNFVTLIILYYFPTPAVMYYSIKA